MGASCSIKESSGPQNEWLHIVLKASKSEGAKGNLLTRWSDNLKSNCCFPNLEYGTSGGFEEFLIDFNE